jgi:rare lipoprotein A
MKKTRLIILGILGLALIVLFIRSTSVGVASYYSNALRGRKTASGERYDPSKLTAAHKSLPLGTVVKVTNLSNNKQVVVKINDRGPYVRGRIIDLSYSAARQLGMLKDGMTKVKVEVVKKR